MPISIPAKDIRFAHAVISRHGGIELSGPVRIKVARISRAVREAAEDINFALAGLVQEHAVKDGDGKPVKVQTAQGVGVEFADSYAYATAERELLARAISLDVEPLSGNDLGEKGFTDIVDALLPFTEQAKPAKAAAPSQI